MNQQKLDREPLALYPVELPPIRQLQPDLPWAIQMRSLESLHTLLMLTSWDIREGKEPRYTPELIERAIQLKTLEK